MKRQRRQHAVQTHGHSRKAALRGAFAFLLLVGAVVDGTVGIAGAEGECGEYSFNFTDTWLINDNISTSAGPFPIDLPAGTYDVTLIGGDAHSSKAHSDQPGERWYVNLNNGWQSPLTEDLPDDADMMTTDLAAQTVPASTAISVHHAGEGNVNSIQVMCVGFTTVGSLGDDSESSDDDASDEMSEDGADDASDEMSEDGADDASDEMSEDGVDDASEEMSEDGADDASDEMSEDEVDDASEEMSEDEADDASEDVTDEEAADPVEEDAVEEEEADDAVEEDAVEEEEADDTVEEDAVAEEETVEAVAAEPVIVEADEIGDGEEDSEATPEVALPEGTRELRGLNHG